MASATPAAYVLGVTEDTVLEWRARASDAWDGRRHHRSPLVFSGVADGQIRAIGFSKYERVSTFARIYGLITGYPHKLSPRLSQRATVCSMGPPHINTPSARSMPTNTTPPCPAPQAIPKIAVIHTDAAVVKPSTRCSAS